MSFAWHIVTKDINAHLQNHEFIARCISKVEKHLKCFSEDALHLQVALEHDAKTRSITASLRLCIGSKILCCRKSSSNLIRACNQSVRALIREIEDYKSESRSEKYWKRKTRRAELHLLKPFRCASPVMDESNERATLREIIQTHYSALIQYVRYQLRRDLIEGIQSARSIHALSLADEVVQRALANPESKPRVETYRNWLFQLARNELRRRYEVERARAIRIRAADWIATEDSPDKQLEAQEMVEQCKALAESLPPEEKAVFNLYFFQGMEPYEIALLERLTTGEVERIILSVRERVLKSV